jgi:hypothetical protein
MQLKLKHNTELPLRARRGTTMKPFCGFRQESVTSQTYICNCLIYIRAGLYLCRSCTAQFKSEWQSKIQVLYNGNTEILCMSLWSARFSLISHLPANPHTSQAFHGTLNVYNQSRHSSWFPHERPNFGGKVGAGFISRLFEKSAPSLITHTHTHTHTQMHFLCMEIIRSAELNFFSKQKYRNFSQRIHRTGLVKPRKKKKRNEELVQRCNCLFHTSSCFLF